MPDPAAQPQGDEGNAADDYAEHERRRDPRARDTSRAEAGSRQTPVSVSARTNASDGTAKLLLDFTPPALPPGDYVLNLRVADGSKSVAAVPFAVR